ncbi:hypothetical protein M0805_002786 [Coniferiporia weirii]|nr:hypothetical protein M0805_002786 [Coniferiporia weirii]
MSSSSDSEESVANITSLVRSVYCDVWGEFYVWDQAYSESTLHSLRRNDSDTALLKDASSIEPQGIDTVTPNTFISNWEFPPGSEGPIIVKAPKLEPTSSYESCAPMSRNSFVGDDPDELRFLPFPYDPKFNLIGYQSHYRSFEWQHRTLNPDLETIILETVTRLNSYHEIPLEVIRKTRVLPDVSMWKLRERDLLQWLVFPVLHKNIPMPTLMQEHTDMRARLEREVSAFCPSLNCTEYFCCSHENDPKIGPPNPSSDIQKLQKMLKPCGPACYYISSIEGQFDSSETGKTNNNPDNSDLIATLSTILSVCPDLSACQLATACRRTCKDVFSAMRKLQERQPLSDGDDTPKSHTEPVGPVEIRLSLLTEMQTQIPRLQVRVPEQAKGPCIVQIYRQMPMRYGREGVRSGNETQCFIQKTSYTGFTQADGDSLCWNSQIQRGKQKGTAVMNSRHGQGLFVTEEVNEGDFIAEYVGEIILEPTVESRDFVNVHRGRNYLFALNNVLSIDASNIGNETRFINHAKGKKANCIALCRLVNGEHRIGIFATKNLKAETELLLNYGRSFFVG